MATTTDHIPTLKEIRLGFQHEGCWLQETTERDPSLTLVISSIYEVDNEIHIDLFVHSPERVNAERAWTSWKHDRRIKKLAKIYDGPRGLRFHVAYTAEHSIYPHIIHSTPISLGAISIACGVEHYTIVGEAEDVQDLIRVMEQEGSAKVESIKDLQEVPDRMNGDIASVLYGQLTDKQIEALILAHEEGYYTWPRISSASDLAHQLGLSIPAFLDHLRRAESKALKALIKDLQSVDPGRFEAARARLKDRTRNARINPRRAVAKV